MMIREIKEKDNHTMECIIKQALEEVGLNIAGTAYFDPQLSKLTQFYETQPNAKYWVIVNETDEVVGGIGIGPFDMENKICELQKLYLAPHVKGLGLSKELMHVALSFAKEHYKYCYLETMKKLHRANTLYSKFGFQLLDQPLSGSEHSTMDTWYIKKL